MTLSELLKAVTSVLTDTDIQFALAGGLASSIYRQDTRLTNDLDIAILLDQKNNQEHVTFSEELISQFNLSPHVVREANLRGGPLFAIKRKSSIPMIVVGRNKGSNTIGLDLLLPTLPWVKDAVLRSRNNVIDFGICKTPCITVEDLIISKFFSHSISPSREKDLDDLRSIFEAKHELELDYLVAKMKEYRLSVPKTLREVAPKAINKI